MNKKILLPERIIKKLCKLPESGMGYQTVTIVLSNGAKLTRRQVTNSEFLILDDQEKCSVQDIVDVELENG